MWLHEHPNWTDFRWDNTRLAVKLADIRHRQGRLLGRMEGLGFNLRQEASLTILTSDVVKSSAIEGEHLGRAEVRSSIARRMGMDVAGLVPSGRDVEGIVEVMLDATTHYAQPLSQDRLYGWHAALFPTGRSGMSKIDVGVWRKDVMQVVSGSLGREKVHFQAPNAARLDNEMCVFLQWFDASNDLDPVVKAGIAHLWFVTIHPFDDGNGRIGRAIADLALARAEKTSQRFYSLSTQIEAQRREYYAQLEKQQRGSPDITPWLEWFLDCLDGAIESAETTLAAVLFKDQLWAMINQNPVNDRQRLVINRMLEEDFKGYMNTSKYAKLADCSNDTALRDIQNLKERAVLIQNPSGGRSTSYRLTDTLD